MIFIDNRKLFHERASDQKHANIFVACQEMFTKVPDLFSTSISRFYGMACFKLRVSKIYLLITAEQDRVNLVHRKKRKREFSFFLKRLDFGR